MPKNCAAQGCSNHNMMLDKKLSFSIFPDKTKQPDRFEKWVQALKRVTSDGKPWYPRLTLSLNLIPTQSHAKYDGAAEETLRKVNGDLDLYTCAGHE